MTVLKYVGLLQKRQTHVGSSNERRHGFALLRRQKTQVLQPAATGFLFDLRLFRTVSDQQHVCSGAFGANQLRSIKNRIQPMRHTDCPNVRHDKFSLQREGTPDIGGTAWGKQVRLNSILDDINLACWDTPALD